MTDAELRAIRERAEDFPGLAVDSPMLGYVEAIRGWVVGDPTPSVPDDTSLWRWYDDAARDRTALLAALDAARADLAGLEQRTRELAPTIERLTGIERRLAAERELADALAEAIAAALDPTTTTPEAWASMRLALATHHATRGAE